ncbi:hypothetical protein FQA39_LY06060 [Lamprigera yunnana]|nr:hypothetical protein FQA39_LY06060 [Lamprigera yunnana]
MELKAKHLLNESQHHDFEEGDENDIDIILKNCAQNVLDQEEDNFHDMEFESDDELLARIAERIRAPAVITFSYDVKWLKHNFHQDPPYFDEPTGIRLDETIEQPVSRCHFMPISEGFIGNHSFSNKFTRYPAKYK